MGYDASIEQGLAEACTGMQYSSHSAQLNPGRCIRGFRRRDRHLPGDGFEEGASDVSSRGEARQAQDHAPRIAAPMRR